MASRFMAAKHPAALESACAVGALHLADLPRLLPAERPYPAEEPRAAAGGTR